MESEHPATASEEESYTERMVRPPCLPAGEPPAGLGLEGADPIVDTIEPIDIEFEEDADDMAATSRRPIPRWLIEMSRSQSR